MYAEDGSNMENRFVIIFIDVAFFLFLLFSGFFFLFFGMRSCKLLVARLR
jgi:hypothetical protein